MSRTISRTTHTHPVIMIFLGVKAAPSAALPDAGHKSAADSAAATEVPEGGDMRKRGTCIRGSSCPHSMAAAGVTKGVLGYGMRPWLDGLEQAFLALFSSSLIA